MGVPIQYRKSGEEAIASYSFTDIITGLGYVDFYMSTTNDSGSNVYMLNTNQNPTNSEYTSKEIPDGTSDSLDIDFDSSGFNYPRVIGGDAIILIPWTIQYSGDVDVSSATCNIYKWDGTTETLLGTETTGNITPGVSLTRREVVFKIPISDTLFKIGDKIRVNIILAGTEQGTGAMYVILYHDPLTAAATGKTLKISIPFRIDL